MYLTVVERLPASVSVRYSLLVHVGTALAATAYYRGTIGEILGAVPGWSRVAALENRAETGFLLAGALVSAGAGIMAFWAVCAALGAVAMVGGVVAVICRWLAPGMDTPAE